MNKRALLAVAMGVVGGWMAPAFGQGVPDPVIPLGQGANIHFVVPNEAEVDRIAQVGYGFVRMDFSWGGTERQAGEYHFDGYDKLVESMARRKIRCIFILDYANRLYDDGLSPHTDAGRKAFAKWAAAAAVHFKGKGILWEIWNEPNISQFWKPKPSAEDYAALALEVIAAVRSADPEARIIGPASSEFPWPFLQVLADKGVLAKLDAVSVHPYRQRDPETAEKDYQRLRLLIDRHSDHFIPIVSGEWGFSTGWKNMTEEKQGQYLPRQWLSNLASDVNLSIWYDWKDDGNDPKEPEHHFGSVRQDLSDKPASLAARKLVETLRGMRYVRRLAVGGADDYLLLFADGKRAIVAAWTTGPAKRIALGAGQEVELDGTPKYVEVAGGLQESGWRPEHAFQVVRAGELAVKLSLDRNQLPQFHGQVIVDSGGKQVGGARVDLTPGQETLSVPVTMADAALETIPLEIKLASGDAATPLQTARATLLVKNALQARLLPVVEGDAMVMIDNPAGEAVQGMLRLAVGNQLLSSPLQLQAGEKSTTVALRVPAGTVPASLEIVSAQGKVLGRADSVLWHPVPSASAWSVHLEGDAKIPGDAKVQAGADLPEPPRPGITTGLEITYSFGNGWRFAVVNPADRKIPGQPRELGLWVYGDGSGNILRCRFKDAGGQTFQATSGEITWTGWKWVTIPMTGNLGHWGPGDGTIRYPVSWEGVILIDNAKLNIGRQMKLYVAGAAVRE